MTEYGVIGVYDKKIELKRSDWQRFLSDFQGAVPIFVHEKQLRSGQKTRLEYVIWDSWLVYCQVL